jgi:hypothetical protein
MGLILLLVILVLLFGGGGFYLGPPFHLLWRRPRHHIGDRYHYTTVEGLTRPGARYHRPPQLAASFIFALTTHGIWQTFRDCN